MLLPQRPGSGAVAGSDGSLHAPALSKTQLRAAEAIARTSRRIRLPHIRSRIDDARLKARKLTRRFGVELASDVHVEGFAKQLGVDIVVARIRGAIAYLVVGIGHAAIYVSDRLIVRSDQRWAISHELGHFVLNHPSPSLVPLSDSPRKRYASQTREHEVEADWFALELLAPTCAVRALPSCDPMTLAGPLQLAAACDISLELAALRVIDSTRRACAVVLSRAGTVRWTAPSTRLRTAGALRAGSWALDERSLASHYFDGRRVSNRPALVPAASWLETTTEPFILEHSLPGSQPGTVLTMLWVPR